MRRLTFRLIVALLTFVIGVTAASLWFVFLRSSPAAVKLEADTSAQAPAKPERRYELIGAGEATTGSFIILSSSDGMRFSKWSVYCGTPQHAKRELQKRLKKAVEIVSREPVFDGGGQQIGEKLVVLFAPNDPDNNLASFLWTEKEELFQVESSSLQNILEYRKDFKR